MRRPTPASNRRSQRGPLLSFWKDENLEPQFRRESRDRRQCLAHVRKAAPRGSGVGFVGSLITLASTPYFTTHPWTRSRCVRGVLPRTGEQPVDGALVLPSRTPDEAIIPTIETLDRELLTRLNTVHLPELRRQNEQPLGGAGGLHEGEILSYLRNVRSCPKSDLGHYPVSSTPRRRRRDQDLDSFPASPSIDSRGVLLLPAARAWITAQPVLTDTRLTFPDRWYIPEGIDYRKKKPKNKHEDSQIVPQRPQSRRAAPA